MRAVTVSGATEEVPTDTATPTTVVNRLDVAHTPGAARSNSLAMITDFVPGAYMTHDQLHIRGGHQTSWLVDGVPVPNTNIASNLGPQFDPKDIDYLEVSRGSYGAELGDRTYGVFNVVPRTGFERNREAELVLSAGNFYQTNDQFSFGSHSERFAYYASVNGNRSNLGIETPVPQVVHDAENGYGGFGSFIFNVNPSNQLRLVTSLRKDFYQVPYDPFPNDIENGAIPENDFTPQYPSIGLRDSDHESDAVEKPVRPSGKLRPVRVAVKDGEDADDRRGDQAQQDAGRPAQGEADPVDRLPHLVCLGIEQAEPARGVDDGRRAHFARAVRVITKADRHPARVEGGVEHAMAFPHVGAAGRRVPQEQLVELGPWHLPGLRRPHLPRDREIGEALDRAVSGAERRAPLRGKCPRPDEIRRPDLLQHVVHRGQERLADVKAREAIPLEEDDAPPGAREAAGHRRARRTSPDDRDIERQGVRDVHASYSRLTSSTGSPSSS